MLSHISLLASRNMKFKSTDTMNMAINYVSVIVFKSEVTNNFNGLEIGSYV